MRKKKLKNISDIPAFCACYPAEVRGYKGFIYDLCERLDHKERVTLSEKFNNIMILEKGYRYAPEIIMSSLFVAEKVIK